MVSLSLGIVLKDLILLDFVGGLEVAVMSLHSAATDLPVPNSQWKDQGKR